MNIYITEVTNLHQDAQYVLTFSFLKGGEGTDYFDVGTELVGLIYTKAHHDDALLAAMLLQVYVYFSLSFYMSFLFNNLYNWNLPQTPLPTLRRKGWPVDRLLQQKFAIVAASVDISKLQQQQQQAPGMTAEKGGTPQKLLEGRQPKLDESQVGLLAKPQRQQQAEDEDDDLVVPPSRKPKEAPQTSYWSKMISQLWGGEEEEKGSPNKPLSKAIQPAPAPPPPAITGSSGGDTMNVR